MSEKNGTATQKTAFDAQKGKGRPKGVPNKATTAVKEMVLAALDKSGGEDYLVTQARENPVAFMTLLGKVIPLQVNASHSGGVTVTRIELVPLEGANSATS